VDLCTLVKKSIQDGSGKMSTDASPCGFGLPPSGSISGIGIGVYQDLFLSMFL
jgi:hypothetical protein